MKKVFVILVAMMAVTTSMFAQNSDTLRVKALDLEISNLTAELATGIISCQNHDCTKSHQEFVIGGPNCPGCKGLLPNSPLILIDGLEVSPNVLAQLKPKNVQSFSVITDARAFEMYGLRGINRVVIIKSKLNSKDLKKMIKKAQK